MKLIKRPHRIISDRAACFRRAWAGPGTRGLLLIGLLIGFLGWLSSVSGIIESGALLSDGIWAMYTNPFAVLTVLLGLTFIAAWFADRDDYDLATPEGVAQLIRLSQLNPEVNTFLIQGMQSAYLPRRRDLIAARRINRKRVRAEQLAEQRRQTFIDLKEGLFSEPEKTTAPKRTAWPSVWILLQRPNAVDWALHELPASRDAAIEQVNVVWTGPGAYTFIQEAHDPDSGENTTVEMTLTAYAKGEFGLTELSPGNGVDAIREDITRYLKAVAGDPSESAITLTLNTYDNTPDCRPPRASLSLENAAGETIGEFRLTVGHRLRLSRESESPNDPVYVCELPTLRAVFRFVQIARDTFHCDHVEFHPAIEDTF
ncbi:hypothetical protein A6D6_03101 [Alcanivorax xiamenensis]|uniref:Uncharacterized protein n=2 Tax=Oceanospirillales TaxID=135619 RepID=A0ABQ6Y555_9GAMM|nr:hypothetical protein A6D6_03101 [Alcanivorax xiamenensis]